MGTLGNQDVEKKQLRLPVGAIVRIGTRDQAHRHVSRRHTSF